MTTVEDANYSLSKILDSGSKKNLIELAWIKNVRVILPRIIITLSLPSFANSQRERIVKEVKNVLLKFEDVNDCLLYTSPSPRDRTRSRMPSSA